MLYENYIKKPLSADEEKKNLQLVGKIEQEKWSQKKQAMRTEAYKANKQYPTTRCMVSPVQFKYS